ncbi:MAG: NADP-dependent oxidoreductase [Nakamurella sp.]
MKAFVARTSGATTVELTEVPVPRIDEDELLVQVRAIGVGIHDSYYLPSAARYPFVVGIEAAGVVEGIGAQESAFQVGDRITFVSAMQLKGGTWAEYVAVKANSPIMPIPVGMDFAQAAAIPIAGDTALRALQAVAIEPADGSIFIAGGSGAIGTLAIQLARKEGLRVAASASKANQEYLRGLGANLAVDYRDSDWPEQVRQWAPGGVDAAIAVPPDTAADSMSVVRDGGVVVAVSGDQVHSERGVQVRGVPHQMDTRGEMAQLLTDIAAGEILVEIEHVYPFEEAPAALAKVQMRHARGKLVLRLS